MDNENEIEALRKANATLRAELNDQRLNNQRRNTELDALHYVWCDGGCASGVHRYEHRGPLTQEMVDAAVRNTKRLVTWWNNAEFKTIPVKDRNAYLEGVRSFEAHRAILAALPRPACADCGKPATRFHPEDVVFRCSTCASVTASYGSVELPEMK